jgi:primosomal protein N'
MIAECGDCGRVELYRNRCPQCGSAALAVPGGIPARAARTFPWLRKLKPIRPTVVLQRSITGFAAFKRKA